MFWTDCLSVLFFRVRIWVWSNTHGKTRSNTLDLHFMALHLNSNSHYTVWCTWWVMKNFNSHWTEYKWKSRVSEWTEIVISELVIPISHKLFNWYQALIEILIVNYLHPAELFWRSIFPIAIKFPKVTFFALKILCCFSKTLGHSTRKPFTLLFVENFLVHSTITGILLKFLAIVSDFFRTKDHLQYNLLINHPMGPKNLSLFSTSKSW